MFNPIKTDKRINFLNIDHVSDDFSGRLIGFLGQGLGDTVKGLRLAQLLRERYRYAKVIVYADPRWKDLIKGLEGIEWQFYPKGIDLTSPGIGDSNPIPAILNEILSDPFFEPNQNYLFLGDPPGPDVFASGLTDIEYQARKINLHVKKKDLLPFIPVNSIDTCSADEFLTKNGMAGKTFCVIAPHTWPVKDWGYENFSWIAEKLNGLGIHVVVLGVSGPILPEVPFGSVGIDLPLPTVLGILQKASLFLGNDSGLSHIASGFDIPGVVIYVNRDDMVFVIRALSGRLKTFIGSRFSDNEPERLDQDRMSVYRLLAAIAVTSSQEREHFCCPLCGREMDYYLSSPDSEERLLCFCGSILIVPRSSLGNHQEQSYPFEFPDTVRIPIKGSDQVTPKSVFFKNPFDFTDDDWEFVRINGYRNNSSDGMLQWSQSHQWELTNIEVDFKSFFWCGTFNRPSGKNDLKFRFPFGRGYIRQRISDYLKFFAWQIWARPIRWRGMVRLALEQKKFSVARMIAWELLRMDPCFKNFRYWVISSLTR